MLRIVRIFSLILLMTQFWSLAAYGLPSGRTDRLKGAPFYKSYVKKIDLANRSISCLPVSIDKTTKEEFFYTGRERVLLPLADVMSDFLDSIAVCSRLSRNELPLKGSPALYAGSSEGDGAPPSASEMRLEHDKYPPMILYCENPSQDWRAAYQEAVTTDYLLLLNIGFAQYPKADKGIFGKKVVLGTGYEHHIRFLSAIDKPVEVLQVTGLLLDKQGNILRVGAEGIFHEDTPFWAQIWNVQKSPDDAAVRRLLTEERREDLPGRPFAWQAALQNLVAQLLSNKELLLTAQKVR